MRPILLKQMKSMIILPTSFSTRHFKESKSTYILYYFQPRNGYVQTTLQYKAHQQQGQWEQNLLVVGPLIVLQI